MEFIIAEKTMTRDEQSETRIQSIITFDYHDVDSKVIITIRAPLAIISFQPCIRISPMPERDTTKNNY